MKSRTPPKRHLSSVKNRINWGAISGRWCVIALLMPALPLGCRRAAFNELYVENMASEVRMLEDRVYEYDAAYQSLEQELADTQRKCLEIQEKYKSLKGNANSHGSAAPRSLNLNGQSRTAPPSFSGQPEVIVETPPSIEYSGSPSTIHEEIQLAPEVPRAPAKPPVIESVVTPDVGNTAPRTPTVKPDTKKNLPETVPAKPSGPLGSDDIPILPPPKSLPPTVPESNALPSSGLPGVDRSTQKKRRESDLVEDVSLPPGMIRSAQAPSGRQPLASPPPPSAGPTNSKNSNGDSVRPGLMAPPALPKLDQGTILQGKINLPKTNQVVLASAVEPVQGSKGNSKVLDDRVVEIAFHPTLSRGHNFDTSPGDDGLYLVLTPRNQHGESINQTGDLTIVVEETVDGESSRVAAWEVGAKELAEYLEPIGTSQGYHLSLPWQQKTPIATLVHVFVKFVTEDGRTMVNKREVNLRKPGIRQSAWTPR